MEEEKKELSARLFKEREEKEKMAEMISELQNRATELQARWDSHSCQTAEASSGASSLSAQMSIVRAEIEVLEKQASTARQKIGRAHV